MFSDTMTLSISLPHSSSGSCRCSPSSWICRHQNGRWLPDGRPEPAVIVEQVSELGDRLRNNNAAAAANWFKLRNHFPTLLEPQAVTAASVWGSLAIGRMCQTLECSQRQICPPASQYFRMQIPPWPSSRAASSLPFPLPTRRPTGRRRGACPRLTARSLAFGWLLLGQVFARGREKLGQASRATGLARPTKPRRLAQCKPSPGRSDSLGAAGQWQQVGCGSRSAAK